MTLRRLLFIFLLLVGIFTTVSAQSERPASIGITLQVYPAGIITNGMFSKAISPRQVLTGLGGYNFTDRRDFGEHDNEEGGGPGLGLAIRHFFEPDYSGWQIGLRVDLWFMEIDWRDDQRDLDGTTDITVLQPTAQGGYRWQLGNHWTVDALVSFGMEINIRTTGEDVGEGAILLGGVEVRYRL